MKIIEYRQEFKPVLLDISLQWLNRYDLLEDIDVEMLTHPEHILDSGGHIFLAEQQDGQIIGMVMLEPRGSSCELLKLGVLESARGQGAGAMLLDAAISCAEEEGFEKITLCSNHQLEAALKLYESRGFWYIDYEERQFQLSDVAMELMLKQSHANRN